MEMQEMRRLAIFSDEEFEKLEKVEIKPVKYGDVELDSDEEAAMKLHPKMAIPRRLEQGYLDLESIDKDENEEERNRQKDKEEKHRAVIWPQARRHCL